MDPNFSDPGVSQLIFEHGLRISEKLDPIINWEIPLILAFAAGVHGYPRRSRGLVLTISTDSHLWAASFGLTLLSSRKSSYEPNFRRAAWDPNDQRNVHEEDRDAQLCWFIPDVEVFGIPAGDTLRKLITTTIDQPIANLLQVHEDGADPEGFVRRRERLARFARCLLAPLLTAFPGYRGPMLWAPPEAWLIKLLGPRVYINYEPPWYGSIKSGLPEVEARDPSLVGGGKHTA
jgi:hypothetical protein